MAIFSDENDPLATVTNLPVGETVLVWTINNGPCAAPTADEVAITIYNDTLAPANAGDDAAYCTPISTHTMNAIDPSLPAIGLWTLESGTGTIASVNSPISAISGLGVGANVFRWTIQNGPCPGTVEFDEITLLIFDENAPVANAGPDQELCSNPVGLVNTFLNANTPIFPATGEWTLISGGGIIGDAANPLTAVTDLPVGENIFQWTYENTPCAEGATTDLVTVFVYNIAQLFANAGGDQSLCLPVTSSNMTATTPIFPATGIWVLVSGAGGFVDNTDPSTEVTGLEVGENIFRWSVTNAPCSPATTLDLVFQSLFMTTL